MRKLILILILACLAAPALWAQTLQDGAWTGSATTPEGQTFGLIYNVSHPDGVLTLRLDVEGQGSFPTNDAAYAEGNLTFGLDAGGTYLSCLLVPQADGGLSGDCVDQNGESGQLILVTPASSQRPRGAPSPRRPSSSSATRSSTTRRRPVQAASSWPTWCRPRGSPGSS